MRKTSVAELQSKKWGRLEVLGEGPGKRAKSGRVSRTVVVKCDCGAEKTVSIENLIRGLTRSCGCLRIEKLRDRAGPASVHVGGKEYHAWVGMKSRCYNKQVNGWENYGGRGIKVCDKWRSDFNAFLLDVGLAPSGAHSIDRLEVDGDYEPGNVKWSTRAEQSYNRRNARWLEVNGERIRLCDAAKRWGVESAMILTRINQLGWCATCAATVLPDMKRGGGERVCQH